VVKWLIHHWADQGRTVVVIATEGLGAGMQDKFIELHSVTPYAYKLDNFLPEASWLEFVSGVLSAMEEPILFNVGSSWLYENLAALRQAAPSLRVVDQQFNDVGHLASNRQHSNLIDLTVAAYHQLADQLRADGRLSEKVRTIHVGVEKPRPIAAGAVRKFRSSLGIPDDARLILWVGRLADEKRPEWIVRLAEELGNAQTRFLIIGDGPLAAALDQRLIRCPWIHWERHLDSIDIAYAAADVVAITSRVEGVPLTLMEALQAGVQVVATRVGGVPDLDGVDGLALVSPDSFSDLADRLTELLEAKTPETRMNHQFGVDEMLRSYDEAVEAEVLKTGRRGPVALHP
jgi:glycosyltransferase involved in cell wall biosynthesis